MRKTFIILLLSAVVQVSCDQAKSDQKELTSDKYLTRTENSNEPDGIQLMYFHTLRRCSSCIGIENLARGYTTIHYNEQVNSGFISINSIDIEKPENKMLAQKMKVTGSALYIRMVKNGRAYYYDLTQMAFMHIESDPNYIREELSMVIDSYQSLKN